MPPQSDAPNVPSDDAQRVTDRYRVHEVLGRGGMACVYRAVDVNTGHPVALKQLTVELHALETQLLQALALHLLRAGDTTGIRFWLADG